MVAEEMVQQEKPRAKSAKKTLKAPAKKRDVILAPDLHEAVLDSIQQAKAGKTLSHEEVLRRCCPAIASP